MYMCSMNDLLCRDALAWETKLNSRGVMTCGNREGLSKLRINDLIVKKTHLTAHVSIQQPSD